MYQAPGTGIQAGMPGGMTGMPGGMTGIPGVVAAGGSGGGGGSPDPNISGGADHREVKTPPGGRPSGGRSRPSQSPIKRHRDRGIQNGVVSCCVFKLECMVICFRISIPYA